MIQLSAPKKNAFPALESWVLGSSFGVGAQSGHFGATGSCGGKSVRQSRRANSKRFRPAASSGSAAYSILVWPCRFASNIRRPMRAALCAHAQRLAMAAHVIRTGPFGGITANSAGGLSGDIGNSSSSRTKSFAASPASAIAAANRLRIAGSNSAKIPRISDPV
jgi:hypothetical protein